ncbi:MerC family mercury resistance protein [Kiloniella laminariae]|uniref:MerC family mercury resistance protein n=1 Tax=Kiloniella laminariae TaxID=454162 RepID=A0ABT4LFP1_9PROT|nr:MerC family mercury resistance protein [Kiloniella laminariae]MCZ4279920.1 MerC family mercury resistance protein [Kiloniella laminariae]
MPGRPERSELSPAYRAPQSKKPKIGWLAAISTTFSFLLCYGTLGVISLLGQLGVALAINDTLWAGGIVITAWFAVAGLVWGILRHQNPWPSLLGGAGALGLTYTMYLEYSILIEMSGFLLLCLAALWDWRSPPR